MLIQNLEQKTRLALFTVLLTIVGCTVTTAFCAYYCAKLITDERNQIYILDGDIPFLAQRSKQEANFVMEAKAHIQLFHYYFFNLPPDNDYIKWTLGKAMYMADGTAMKQKQAMDENGFYSDIVSSSSVCTIICDSIHLDEHRRKFVYYGTQMIKRRSRDMKRSIITTGYLENVPRTQNNPHGLLITNWRTWTWIIKIGHMKKKIKRWKMFVETKTRKQAEGLIHKLFTKWRLRERIDYVNRWALRNKGKTLGWTVGLLFLSLFVGLVLSICQTGEAEQNPLTGIEKVRPIFDGLQSIQDRKTYQIRQMEGLAARGQLIKEELDSLVKLPEKSHEDSARIIIRYKQLETVVGELKNGN